MRLVSALQLLLRLAPAAVVWLACVVDAQTLRRVSLQTCECGRELDSSPSPFLSRWRFLDCLDACPVRRDAVANDAELAQQPFAAVLHADVDFDSRDAAMLRDWSRHIPVYVQTARQHARTEDEASVVELFEFGKRTHGPFDVSQAHARGTLRLDLQGRAAGPIGHPDSWFPRGARLADCVHTAKRLSLWDYAWQPEELERCDDGEDEDAGEELWRRALEMRLVDAAEAARGRNWREHVQAVWPAAGGAACWLAISWVPVFESARGGLGTGRRGEAVLVELLMEGRGHGGVQTAGGRGWEAGASAFAALLSCPGQALDDVVDCVRRALPSRNVQGVVLGMGFVGARAYEGVRADWNAHPRYAGTGEFPNRLEDRGEDMQPARDGL